MVFSVTLLETDVFVRQVWKRMIVTRDNEHQGVLSKESRIRGCHEKEVWQRNRTRCPDEVNVVQINGAQ